MSKKDILEKFRTAVCSGNAKQSIAALHEFRRDYVDMYFVKEEFSKELTHMLHQEWNRSHSHIWEEIYTNFKPYILMEEIFSVFGDPLHSQPQNFWIYEAFVRAGAAYPLDNFELFLCAVQGGTWETVQQSLQHISADKYPEIVFLALNNDDQRVHKNLYTLFPERTIENLHTVVSSQQNVLWTQDFPPPNKSMGYQFDSKHMDRLKDFLAEQQKERLLAQLEEKSITHIRKM